MERFEVINENPLAIRDKYSNREFVPFPAPKGYVDMKYKPGFIIPYGYIESAHAVVFEKTETATLSAEDVMDENTVKHNMLPLLLALREMHNGGKVYGNLSPEHIYETKNGFFLQDFGIGKQQKDKNRYSAYEYYTFQGSGLPASDVYSVCAVIYELLTSIPLDTAEERVDTGGVLEPLSAFGVSAELEQIIEKGLHVFPDDRYKDAGELLSAIYSEKEIEEYISDYAIFTRPIRAEEEKIEAAIREDEKKKKEIEEATASISEEETISEKKKIGKKHMLLLLAGGVLLTGIVAAKALSGKEEPTKEVIQYKPMPVLSPAAVYESDAPPPSGSAISSPAAISFAGITDITSSPEITETPFVSTSPEPTSISTKVTEEATVSNPPTKTPAPTMVPTPKPTKQPTEESTKKPKKHYATTKSPVYYTQAPKITPHKSTPKKKKGKQIKIGGGGIVID